MAGYAIAGDWNDAAEYPDNNPAPVPFWDAVRRGIDMQTRVANDGVREERFRAEMWRRHREIERRLGRKLPLAHSLTGERTEDRDFAKRALDALIPVDRINAALLGRSAALDDDAYEAQLEKLRAENPGALDGVESRRELMARIDSDFRRIAQANAESFNTLGGAAGGVVGGIVGTLADPANAGVAIATGGAGAGRPLLTRMLAQFGANAFTEALTIPGRVEDARRFGGPEVSAGEAATDVLFAGGAGAAFEGLGSGLRAGWRAWRGVVPKGDPVGERALEQLELFEADEKAIGPTLSGLDFDEAADRLANNLPKPNIEPDRDLGDLFGGDLSTRVNGGQLVEAEYRGRRIFQTSFDPTEVDVDPVTFQYKADADAEGVTARLRGVGRWDPTASGKVIVYEAADGRRIIADGHQRRGLARRLAEEGWDDARLDGFLFRAADGWTPREVRVIAALKNIREGSGSPLDAAKVFRDAPAAINDRSLPVTGDFIAAARGLARLSPEAFGAVVNKVIPERYGAEIGAMAPERADLHDNMVKLLKEAEPANLDEARSLIQEALLDDFVKAEGLQADLFGNVQFASTTIARAKVKAAVLRALKADARIFGQLVRHADAIEAGGNALARDANEAALALDRAALELVSKLSLRAGPIGEAMAEAAEAVAKGGRAGDAAKKVLAKVRKAIRDGERLDDVRAERLNPEPPTAGVLHELEGYEPGGERAALQAEPRLEDEGIEAGGLFDDLPPEGTHERVKAALEACATGKIKS